MATPAPRALEQLLEHFDDLPDPRVKRAPVHSLESILVFAICGAICGVEGWDDLAYFAEVRRDWFASFLQLRPSAPSADTFRRVFERLDPEAFAACFGAWVDSLAQSFQGQVVAVDGKSIKGAFDAANRSVPLHLVHVWAVEQGLLLAQQAVPGAPGEIAAVPELLRMLELEGAVVTADANNCTTAVAEAAVEGGADYTLALKANRRVLYKHATAAFEAAEAAGFEGISRHEEVGGGHGREEVRRVWAMPALDCPMKEGSWPGLRSLVLVERERAEKGERASVERHYYLSSLPPVAERLAEVIRQHWGIENGLHYTLDVSFREDDGRVRNMRAAENYAVLRRMALMLLKRSPGKRSIALKRKGCSWDGNTLLQVLASGIRSE